MHNLSWIFKQILSRLRTYTSLSINLSKALEIFTINVYQQELTKNTPSKFSVWPNSDLYYLRVPTMYVANIRQKLALSLRGIIIVLSRKIFLLTQSRLRWDFGKFCLHLADKNFPLYIVVIFTVLFEVSAWGR